MPIRPSIVLEGASRAADWIPFAQNMLRGMSSDGTSNFNPEDGITIVIFRHGSVAKISIHATHPTGFRFAGTPYTAQNTSGWGAPYDEDNPQGTAGSFSKREVVLEKAKGVWAAKRYPRYKVEYPEIEFGNMDWTSADGQTVLTWDGPNSGTSCEMSYHRQIIGVCCEENIPANEWHKGYRYPGFVSALSATCDLVVYIPQKVTAVDDQEPLDVESELFLGHNIYMNGEILITMAVGGEFNAEGDLSEGAPLYVYGAAIQIVSDVKYLVAMLSDYEVIEGGQTTSYRGNKQYLYRAPMTDLTDYELTDVGVAAQGGGHNTDAPWGFNSTGTKAVGVYGQTPYVAEITIADDGSVTSEVLWNPNTDGAHIALAPDYKSPLDFGELDYWEASGRYIMGVGYKDDVVRYAVIYSKFWEETGITLDNPTDPECDTVTYKREYDMQGWVAFMDDPHAMNEQYPGAVKAYSRHEIFTEDTISDTVTRTTQNESDKKHPIFIDCRYDAVVFHNLKEPKNAFSYLISVGSATTLLPALATPPSYASLLSIELQIEGITAYESVTNVQQRSPGDCFTTSIYSLSSGKACDQTGYQLYITGQDGVDVGPPHDFWFEAYNVAAFCNVQIHKTNPEAPDFDILFTARTKYSDLGAPSDSFVAHWDGGELINRQDVSTLLDIDEDGVLATTGKI